MQGRLCLTIPLTTGRPQKTRRAIAPRLEIVVYGAVPGGGRNGCCWLVWLVLFFLFFFFCVWFLIDLFVYARMPSLVR